MSKECRQIVQKIHKTFLGKDKLCQIGYVIKLFLKLKKI